MKKDENGDTDFEDLFQFEEDLYKNKLRLSFTFLTYSIHFLELFLSLVLQILSIQNHFWYLHANQNNATEKGFCHSLVILKHHLLQPYNL